MKIDAILLAAGYSTRLYPLTKNFPKPLLDVGGKPVITNIIDKMENFRDLNKIYVVTNNRYLSHFNDWRKNLKTNLKIEIVNDGTLSEEDKLGAIGDIYFAIKEKSITNPVFMIGGDQLFDFQLNDIVTYFKEKNKDVISVCMIKDKNMLKHHGVVKLDKDNKIISFKEKPSNPFSNLAANCLHIYSEKTIAMLKEYLEQGNNPDQPGRFIEWLYPKKEVYGFISKGNIIDIGTPETLEKARKEFTFSS
ncbi:nucleotidyltransferase family protein [Candidatus Woesearchaeota archaeon]|nr:nucleotidyltransferase family protein [Candidatus Woesearchaeota archaeon]